jgi:PhnB protein
MSKVKPIPEGYPRISPYLCVDGADAAIAFYQQVFGATVRMRMGGPDGKVGHSELAIGDATHVEDVSAAEMERRSAEMLSAGGHD